VHNSSVCDGWAEGRAPYGGAVLLTPEHLNRTLLARQGLLERRTASVADLVGLLVGLQAQENRAPYLGLAARLDAFDPYDVTRGLEDRSLVRMLSLRSTVHLLTADDACAIRGYTGPAHDRELRASATVRPARHIDPLAFEAATRSALAESPLPVAELGARLHQRFPEVSPAALAGLARVTQPLVQLPPRGTWGRSGGVVYQYVDRWVGRPLAEPDPTTLILRYLRAFGPASAADVTTWSGVPGAAGLLAQLPELVRHADERGRTLFDVADGVLADADRPAPVRLLGSYDNVWLTHAARDRVTTPGNRRRWMGANGAAAHALFVDGWLEGLWRVEDGRPMVVEQFRAWTLTERRDLDDELARVGDLLTR
jgi:DNA glycosylase AlkZ-like